MYALQTYIVGVDWALLLCFIVHEGALVQGLLVLSHWCTHFSTQVPKVLVDAFKVRRSVIIDSLKQDTVH